MFEMKEARIDDRDLTPAMNMLRKAFRKKCASCGRLFDVDYNGKCDCGGNTITEAIEN